MAIECGQLQSLLEAIASALYIDSNGNVRINVEAVSSDCDIESAITCENNHVAPDDLIKQAVGVDNCQNNAIRLFLSPGNLGLNFRIITETDAQVETDELVICDSAVAMNFSLLPATGSGRRIYVKNIGAGVVTLDAGVGEIDDSTTVDINQYECLHMIDYAVNEYAII